MFHFLRGRWLIALCYTLLLFPLQSYSDQAQATSSSKVTLLVLGDSLSAAYGLKASEGWVSLLHSRWQDEQLPIDVINAAISGETTDGGLARLPRLLEQHQPTHVLIELGGNDGLQGHPVSKLQNNLKAMIDLVRDSGATPLLQDMAIPTNYGRRYTEMFTGSYEKVASETDVTLVPFFMQDIALEPALMQRDGIHPNAQAQPRIVAFMYDQLTPLLLPSQAALGESDIAISYNFYTL
ncbi:arylesterase [Alteromonas sp. CYL-A6]|uniref:arylesterase n=1 Tax=Alteromonas nitratireducens TaxID=3390813 RepID=UPI0034AAF744